MADYDSSLPVRTRTTEHLQANITQVGGTTISATNPIFAELTDGTAAISASNPLDVQIGDGTTQAGVSVTINALKVDLAGEGGAAIAVGNPVFVELSDGTTALTATTIGADYCLDINIAGEGGAVLSATNPLFAELTDGTAAISASNPLDVQIGDGTTQAGVSVTINALKVDLAGEGGTAISVTNPVFVELSDGTNAIGVDASHPVYTSPASPANTFIEFTTGTVNAGATDTTTFKKEAASGSIYVQRIIVSASGAHKAEVNYTEGGVLAIKAVDFATSAFPKCIFEFDCYKACACSQAADGIHVHVTNREGSNMDVYCSIIGHT